MTEEESTTTTPPAAEATTASAVVGESEPKPAPNIPTPDKHWFWGLGRRKRSVARVRLKPGDGKFIINKREINDYFSSLYNRQLIVGPLKLTETAKVVDVYVNVKGGGTTGQAGAIAHGLGRALVAANPDYMVMLRDNGFLTRDSRRVERKKPGMAGARKRFQFSKR